MTISPDRQDAEQPASANVHQASNTVSFHVVASCPGVTGQDFRQELRNGVLVLQLAGALAMAASSAHGAERLASSLHS
jgi:hypothetical protein